MLSNPLTSRCPHPGEDLQFPPFLLGLHFSSRANTSRHHLPIRRREARAFSAETWQMAPSERRCPRILSSWLPWLVKAGDSNASTPGPPASLSFVLQQQQRHFKGTAINSRFLDSPRPAVRSPEELIPQPWRQIQRASHVPSHPQSVAFLEMSMLATSEKQERKCRSP